jgi:3-methyladenine DNA glycosylase/8-oxoguanine DNA glycosylase
LVKKLVAQDARFKAVVQNHGFLQLKPKKNRSAFLALCRAIIYQQLSGKAAATIYGRFLELFADRKVSATHLQDMSVERLRFVGVSRPKALALIDLAEHAVSGRLPSTRALARMNDDQIVEALTAVRGVGPWTAQMYLIFTLGRSNVMPALDLGVRKGFAILSRSKKLPDPEALLRHSNRWQPHRSFAALYLWRLADERSS